MKSLLFIAAGIAPALAIPPAEFGFPETANHTELSIAYTFNANTTVVEEAQLFGSNITSAQPVLAVDPTRFKSIADYTGQYLVIMVDPDAPTPDNPTRRFILHWLQTNLTATNNAVPGALAGQRVLTGTTTPIAPYVPPGPPPTSSAHRYIIYAFQQPSNFAIPAAFSGFSATNRTNFNIDDFIRASGLSAPAAADYFYVSRATNVPGTFIARAGGQYPGGNGNAIFSGSTTGGGSTTTTSSGTNPTGTNAAVAARAPGLVGGALGAGLLGLAAIL